MLEWTAQYNNLVKWLSWPSGMYRALAAVERSMPPIKPTWVPDRDYWANEFP